MVNIRSTVHVGMVYLPNLPVLAMLPATHNLAYDTNFSLTNFFYVKVIHFGTVFSLVWFGLAWSHFVHFDLEIY